MLLSTVHTILARVSDVTGFSTRELEPQTIIITNYNDGIDRFENSRKEATTYATDENNNLHLSYILNSRHLINVYTEIFVRYEIDGEVIRLWILMPQEVEPTINPSMN